MSFEIPSYALYYDDEAEIRDKYWHPKTGDTVIDVGARYGSYTLPALAAGARVVAVDYNAVMLGHLAEAAFHNGFRDLEAMCLMLYDGTEYPAELSAQIAEPCPPPGCIWSTLDDIILERVDWVKIDVEGAELGVLVGGTMMLDRDHPKLIIEDHTRVYDWCRDNQIGERVRDLLESFGYRVESVPYEAPSGSPRDFTIAT